MKLAITVPFDVGFLKEGSRSSSEVRRPQFEEGVPKLSIREGHEELTLRKEGGAKKRVSMLMTPRRTDGDHLWLMLIGMQTARRSTKVLKVETGRNCTSTTKN